MTLDNTESKLYPIQDQLGLLWVSRELLNQSSKYFDEAHQNWLSEMQPSIDEINTLKEKVAGTEESVRELTLKYHEQDTTKNKTPLQGLGIRDKKSFIYDEVTALKWALEHNIAIALDTKAFEKAIRAGLVPNDVAQIEVNPICTISPRNPMPLTNEQVGEATI